MKYILVFVGLICLLPFASWLRRNPQNMKFVWLIIGALPFVLSTGPHPLFVALISWATWPGYVKGVEISLIDMIALAIYFSQPRTHHRLPFRLSMAFYFAAVLLSILVAHIPMAALFYAWQLARMFLVYSIVSNACASDDRAALALMTGMTIGLWIAVGFAAWQRLDLDALRAGGTVGEKNLFGFMAHFVGMPWFALLLAGQRGKLPYLAPLGTALTGLLTVSRAALGLTAIGMSLLFLVSVARKWTPRKTRIAILCAIALLVLVPMAISSLDLRFKGHLPQGGYDERAAFERAAMLIIARNPLGIGANNYVIVANVRGYDEEAGVAPTPTSLSTNVHNVYLLTASELGYLGLVTFVIMLLRPMFVALHCGWRNRGDSRGDLLLGLGVALLVIYIHSLYEWIFLLFSSQYLFAMITGLVAGLAQQLGYWQRTRVISSSAAPNMIQEKSVR